MEKKVSRKKEYLIAAVILVLAVIALVVFRNFSSGSKEAAKGKYSITVEVKNDAQDVSKQYYIDTDETTLGDTLEKENLIDFQDSQYGRYIIGVDGMKADDSKEEWWSVLVDGESSQVGVDEIQISDGAVYTLELKVGY